VLLRADGCSFDIFIARVRIEVAKLMFNLKRGELIWSAAPSHMIAAYVDDDSVEPGREVLIDAECAEVPVHSQENFLGCIASIFPVA
jgi:hypothetical protein